jgi:hypothetical protein
VGRPRQARHIYFCVLQTAAVTFESGWKAVGVDGKQYVSMTAGANPFTFARFDAQAKSR